MRMNVLNGYNEYVPGLGYFSSDAMGPCRGTADCGPGQSCVDNVCVDGPGGGLSQTGQANLGLLLGIGVLAAVLYFWQ